MLVVAVTEEGFIGVEITNKPQVIKLLQLLPIRHPEKISKMNLVYKIQESGLIYWDNVKEVVLKLRRQIKESVTHSFISRCL